MLLKTLHRIYRLFLSTLFCQQLKCANVKLQFYFIHNFIPSDLTEYMHMVVK